MTSVLLYHNTFICLEYVKKVQILADSGGRAVFCVHLKPLNCRDRGFESRWGHSTRSPFL